MKSGAVTIATTLATMAEIYALSRAGGADSPRPQGGGSAALDLVSESTLMSDAASAQHIPPQRSGYIALESANHPRVGMLAAGAFCYW